MAKHTYQTLSLVLAEVAEEMSNYFHLRGYNVASEKQEVSHPYTPALTCRRQHTILLCEVASKVNFIRMDQWVSYCRSCTKDTRIALCVAVDNLPPGSDQHRLRELGIGVYVFANDQVQEIFAPVDLALQVALPPLDKMPVKLRRLLGNSYDQFGTSNWREGFETACQAIESESRKYLKQGFKRGRIILQRGANTVVLPDAKVEKMTLGQLAVTFSEIQAQNHADTILERALSAINKDRVGVAHHKQKGAVERRLRANVGRHMWTIVQALKQLI